MTDCHSCGESLAHWDDDARCWVETYSGMLHDKSRCKKFDKKRWMISKGYYKPKETECKKCGLELKMKIYFERATSKFFSAMMCPVCGKVPFSTKEIEDDIWEKNYVLLRNCPYCGCTYSTKLKECPGCISKKKEMKNV